MALNGCHKDAEVWNGDDYFLSTLYLLQRILGKSFDVFWIQQNPIKAHDALVKELYMASDEQ
ncbi:11370_t:CDS:2, partial [Paraglomus brasilianum]